MKNEKVKIDQNGHYVRGVVVSSTAKALPRKDGSGTIVIAKHELAMQPGVILWEEFLDPRQRTDVTVHDGNVTAFPQLKEFEPVTVQVKRIKQRGDAVMISDGERIA